MPVKDGDMVYYKIKNGQVRSGKYDAKTKAVTNKNGQKAFPPKKALHHTIQGAKDAPFTPRKTSSDILGAPKRYPTKKETPKQKVTILPKGSLQKRLNEIKRSEGGKMIDLDREPGYSPQKVNSNDLVKPSGIKKGEKFKIKTDAGYSTDRSPYVRSAEYKSANLFTTDNEGVTLKKFTAKQKKERGFSKRLEEFSPDEEAKQHLLPIAEWYLDAEEGSKAYKDSYEMRRNPLNRLRFTVDYTNKRIIQIL